MMQWWLMLALALVGLVGLLYLLLPRGEQGGEVHVHSATDDDDER